MAFAHVQDNNNTNFDVNTTVTVALTGVTAGNLIVLWTKWEGGDTTVTCSDGTSSLTAGTKLVHTNADLGCMFFYLLSANSGDKTYTVTFGANRTFKRAVVMEIDYANTCEFDQQNTGQGSSTTPTSGNITTTGSEEAVFGGYGEYADVTNSSHEINNEAADNVETTTYASMWWKRKTSTFTGNADCTVSGSSDWICNVISFKEVAAGGAAKSTRLLTLGCS